MRELGRLVLRVVFWSYERGTWPYDLMVVAIVLFVLLTPRTWFHDQPQVGSSARVAPIQLLQEDPATKTQTYRVGAQLLTLPKRTPELERETHEILSKNVSGLKGHTFRIVQIEPVRGEDGSVLGYDVSVKPSR